MWKILHYLFGWDYVLTKFCGSWEVRKVTWFLNDAFCKPCSDREFINNSEYTDYRTIWKPLTPNMFKYKSLLKLTELKKVL